MNAQADSTSIGTRVLSRTSSAQLYELRLATTAEEIRAAQTLRFLVFNLELNEGLEQSFATCLDADPFDEICDHLIVVEKGTREIVGTYRLQTGNAAVRNKGFYSASEFDLTPFNPIVSEIVELGRACVHRQHRNLQVLSLLWGGIAAYCRERNCRYLIGCSSIPSTDPTIGARVYSDLCRKHLVDGAFQTTPLPHLACPLDQLSAAPFKLPKLLGAYLSLGAKICGAPALDQEFKTIDFLTLLDLNLLSPRMLERFSM
ncbi:MAG: GNAT family N-acyltransferase [Verrucomicrobiota bacterium]|nr:GNAT family N-acyltransferase [Verrucomicrobiota bacterium]